MTAVPGVAYGEESESGADTRFGFRVEYVDYPELTYRGGLVCDRVVGWVISLPHQCDRWGITGEDAAMDKEAAVRAMEEFIAEAQAALEALRAADEESE